MKVIYETEATASGGREGSARTPDGRLDVKLSVPKEMGGSGGDGTNPEQLFAAGYAACFKSALQAAARKEKEQIGTVAVTVRVGLGPTDDGRFRLAIALEASLPDLPQDTAEAFVREAHRMCPYSNATRGDADVRVALVDSDGEVRKVA